jgi:hypothetical protein
VWSRHSRFFREPSCCDAGVNPTALDVNRPLKHSSARGWSFLRNFARFAKLAKKQGNRPAPPTGLWEAFADPVMICGLGNPTSRSHEGGSWLHLAAAGESWRPRTRGIV